ncbi:cobalt-precorrin-5B (C(1))-methyltransferase CbiD [Desulfuromonas sp. AOP6]|uniref:cobalt-precorrin-5B (C(1))-methyltransferase CbiD n=1 Tax=Desulfuromonas sp. AOP6 TaxID=1566351 RepID=UPI0012DE79E7|nr:cobalt-precorrin-5B (C(1))-methyltransferase CbiD [Desulfuromonas sp. AOP6]
MMREGISTGSCAALAAKGAALLLCRNEKVGTVEIPLPDGGRLLWPLAEQRLESDGAAAVVVKDAGDDPDVTNGARIEVSLERRNDNNVCFHAGRGVGVVTLPGLALEVGEPAINPTPRKMIEAALREVTDWGLDVTVSVEDGEARAYKTFNPKLGIEGGLSILGTSGRVRPFSAAALQDSLKCAMDICAASGTRAPVFTPGNIGRRAAQNYFNLAPQQLVEVSNEWGFVLEKSLVYDFEHLLLIGHPGKLAKLAMGQWQTHSTQSDSAIEYVSRLAETLLSRRIEEQQTVEGLFMMGMQPIERKIVAGALAAKINAAVSNVFRSNRQIAVVLINLKGEMLGRDGALEIWQ